MIDNPRAMELILNENLRIYISVDTMDYLIKFRSRFVELAVFYVKDIYMLCKECYAA